MSTAARSRTAVLRTLAGASASLLLAGCSSGTSDASQDPDGTLTVLAASSLTETFTELAATFEQDNAGVEVRLVFDSSATLAGQVIAEAPADVLATADTTTMQPVEDAGLTAEPPRRFATNHLVLVVPGENPAEITSLEDLERSGVTYLACTESAPCGALARSVLDDHRIRAKPSSLEPDVKAVLTKVVLDEADAGLVYASDAVAAGTDVRTVEIPASRDAVTSYLVAPLGQAAEPDLARAWVDLVVSPQGRRALREAGFGPP
jgi:molybdate transport system substrate-binding protein